jgi:hypothetical protein
VLVARHNERRRHSPVEERNPGAAIARMMWNSALLSPFVSSKALLKGANRLGYGVDVVAHAEGLSFWRGGRKIIEHGGYEAAHRCRSAHRMTPLGGWDDQGVAFGDRLAEKLHERRVAAWVCDAA